MSFNLNFSWKFLAPLLWGFLFWWNKLSNLFSKNTKLNSMEYSNLIVLLVLAISPFIYVPYIVPEDKRKSNWLIWFIITFLLGLVNCMCYLVILFLLGIAVWFRGLFHRCYVRYVTSLWKYVLTKKRVGVITWSRTIANSSMTTCFLKECTL